jgi:UDP-glucose 4-epimerase
MNVLVTGGLGYVGGRISRHFAAQSDINLSISTRSTNRRAPDWLGRGRLWQVPGDLQQGSSKLTGIDALVHLATLNETVSNRDLAAALEVNCVGTQRLLEAAVTAKIKHFIYFSTVHVYGTPLKGRLTETTLPRPFQPYAIIHRATEDFVLAAGMRGGMQTTVVRLANAIGAPADPSVERWTLLANDLCRAAVTQRKLELRSTGRQWRNFIALDDVARATEFLIRHPEIKREERIYNLAGERSQRVIEIVNLIAERCHRVLGYRPDIVLPHSAPPDDEAELEIVVERLKESGFTFSGNLEEEIDSTLRFCAAYRQV